MIPPLEYLERQREVLLADLEGLPEAALHWRPDPDTFPISRSLQHVAAFELVLCGTVAWDRAAGGKVLWARVRAGFGRGRAAGDWRDHREMLAAVRALALEWLEATAGVAWEPGDPRPLLRAWGAEAEEVDLVAGNLARDLRTGRGLPFDLVRTLTEHESYHRGQITLLKHLCRRRPPAEPHQP